MKHIQSKTGRLKIEDSLVYIIGAVLAGFFAVVITYPELVGLEAWGQATGQKPISVKAHARTLVNKNLQADEALKTLREQTVIDEHNALKEKSLHFDASVLDEKEIRALDTKVHDGSDGLYEDIYGDDKLYDSSLNPEDRIEAKLRQVKMLEDYDYQQKMAYIELFLENAHEQGFDVHLNDDLEVVKVIRVDPTGPYRGSASLTKILDGEN